jgi:hypothetical protein
MVTVEAAPTPQGWDCVVEVVDGERRSRHSVKVLRGDLERWGHEGEEGPEPLVRRTFDFLLAREPAEQILKSFDLGDVPGYFPEFDREIRGA